jgi:hypothetical protein
MPLKDGAGAVPRDSVVKVLRAILPESGISFAAKNSGGEHIMTLVKDGCPEVIVLPESVPRKMLHRIAYKYGVKIEFFYHPEMCCPGTLTAQ